MEKKLRIIIEADAKTGQVSVVKKELDNLHTSVLSADKAFLSLYKSLKNFALAGSSLYVLNKTIGDLVRKGIEYNKSIETMKIGIASLISVNSKAAEGANKFKLAMRESSKIMSMLKKANLETSATLEQLTQAFQAALAPSLKAGMNIKQTVEYTKLMTQAAGAMGVPMNQLAQELKSVVSGTIDLNSVVATNLGITNEQIKQAKEQGRLYEFLRDKLKDFAEAGNEVSNSWEGMMSNMEDSWSNLAGEITKPIFENLKDDIKDIIKSFNNATESIHNFMLKFRELKNINEIDDIRKKIKAWQQELKSLAERAKNQSFLAPTFYAEMNQIQQKILKAQERINELKAIEKEKIEINTKEEKNNLKTAKLKITVYDELIEKWKKLNKSVLENESVKKAKNMWNENNHEIVMTFKSIGDTAKSSAKSVASAWSQASVSMANSMQQNFFDFMTGRFHSFKDFMKNLLNDMLSNIITPFAKSLSNLFSSGVTGGIVNMRTIAGGLSFASGSAMLEWLGRANVQGNHAILPNGQYVSMDTFSQIANLASGGNLSGAINLLSYGRTAYNAFTGGLQSLIYAPAMGVAQIGTYMQGIPLVGGTLSQGAYGLSTLLAGGNPAIYGTAGMAGATLGAGLLGYLGGTALDKLFGKETKAGIGGGIGAAIGTLIAPGIGSVVGGLLGSVIGGIFGGKTRVKWRKSGVDIGQSTKDYASGRYWAVTHYHKSGGWFSHGKSWDEWRYKGFGRREIDAIKRVIGTFDSLLWMMGDFDKELKVRGGRFSSIEQFLSKNVVKSFLKEVMGLEDLTKTITYTYYKKIPNFLIAFGKKIDNLAPKLNNNFIKGLFGSFYSTAVTATKTVLTEDGKKLNEVYRVWADYAKSIHKKIYEAFADVVNDYIKSKRSFATWFQEFKGNTLEALKLQAKFAQEDLKLIQRTIGKEAANVTIDNYLEAYEKAVKENFTPQVIQQWKALGEALMKVSEAEKKYKEALIGRTGTYAILSGRIDMMMGKAHDATSLNIEKLADEIRNGNSEMKLLFYAILKELKKQTAIEQGLEP
ncbi:hypothetical protein [Nitrosophilus kaiyonis]|uniref:hypothetical protein n=1 Tax=Nitrosophilus kaiyonis TaxID=2930200 RepID=UPI00249369AE|nr:hypothetical protein [Nitrosophilus kaiyonis]